MKALLLKNLELDWAVEALKVRDKAWRIKEILT